MNFLETVAAVKRAEVDRLILANPVERLKEKELYRLPRRSLAGAILARGFGVIAEVKKASPSAGLLRTDFDPVRIGRQYQQGGAAAISVLTDETFFGGRLEHLSTIRSTVPLPLLRKDFVVDPYQLHEAKSAGADAVLLIAGLVGPVALSGLCARAADLGLETLVEVHNEEELRIAAALETPLIGVNNRDLSSLRTSLATSLRLGPMLPPGRAAISESGISSAMDLLRLREAGFCGALIGEFLMRQENPGAALRSLLQDSAGRAA